MRDDRTTTVIWVLAALAAVGVLAVTLVVTRNDGDDAPSPQAELLRQIFGPEFEGDFDDLIVDEEQLAELAELAREQGELRPVGSIEDAEKRAGYHVLSPSSDFTLLDNAILVEEIPPSSQRTTPLTEVGYETSGGGWVQFSAVPVAFGFADPREIGQPATIGAKEGWTLDVGSDWSYFAWNCELGATEELYCVAQGDVRGATFERFVESLR